MQAQYDNLAEQARLQAEENERKQKEMMKIIEKKNYESHYPIPEAIREHNKKNPNSFNIQVKVSLQFDLFFFHITYFGTFISSRLQRSRKVDFH